LSVAVARDIWSIARDLAEAIADSPQMEEYRRTEDAVLADDEALVLIREYEVAKRSVKFSKSQPPAEQIALVERFMQIEEQFNTHPVIQAYWTARVSLDSFMDRVNAVVTFPITGTDAPKIKGGACSTGGGCGSGGGGGCGCG
jgi:cell fate (sporulation/competence/biofilm development) regulator YlbF (YheA/YmcA/DUF963 family)